jgi:hypothetical protein
VKPLFQAGQIANKSMEMRKMVAQSFADGPTPPSAVMSGAWALQSYAAAISGLKASLDWFIAFAVL